MSRLSVKARLTLWNIAILSIVLAGFAALVHFSVRTVLLASVDRDLRREADSRVVLHRSSGGSQGAMAFSGHVSETGHVSNVQRESREITVKLDHRRLDLPDVLKHESAGRRGFMIVRMVDQSGQIVQEFGARGKSGDKDRQIPPAIKGLLDDRVFTSSSISQAGFSTVVADNHPMRVYSCPVEEDQRVTGAVQVAYPLDEVYNTLKGLDWTLLALIPLALMVTGIGGTVITKRALAPVKRISEAAAEVEATADLSRRLPIAGRDEFAELAGTFNGMFGRLESAVHRLEESVEEQRRFTADASHELRTPLTTIKANASWALRKNRPESEYREALTAANEAADRMNRIVEDLLILARSDSDRLDISREEIHVRELLSHAAALGTNLSTNHANPPRIEVEPPDPSLIIEGDSHHLNRLLVNLVDNAMRHTTADGYVRLSACDDGDSIQLRVEDSGEGIPPEHLDHVCERFYRVDQSRNRACGGVGLGLSICKSIAEAHGGHLEIHSESGRGTLVIATLRKAHTIA